MLSCPVRHYCISPRSIKTSKLTAIIKAAAKIRLFGYCYAFLTKIFLLFSKNISEYLCQKAHKGFPWTICLTFLPTFARPTRKGQKH